MTKEEVGSVMHLVVTELTYLGGLDRGAVPALLLAVESQFQHLGQVSPLLRILQSIPITLIAKPKFLIVVHKYLNDLTLAYPYVSSLRLTFLPVTQDASATLTSFYSLNMPYTFPLTQTLGHVFCLGYLSLFFAWQ